MNQAIYVFEAPDRIKVGISKAPSRRLIQVRPLAKGLRFVYAASTNGRRARELEKRAHELLADKRISGEWFSVDAKEAVRVVLQAATELGFVLRARGEMDHEDDQSQLIMIRATKPELRDALKSAAKDDLRSVSTLIEKILDEWLQERGYLPPPKERPEK